jgi:hypothetical protein
MPLTETELTLVEAMFMNNHPSTAARRRLDSIQAEEDL